MLLGELVSDTPLDARRRACRARLEESSAERGAEALRYAVLSALLGEPEDAQVALKIARDSAADGAGPATGRLALATAFVALRAGDAARALAALRRDDRRGEAGPGLVRRLLAAEASALLSGPMDAFREAERCALAADDETDPRVGAYACMVLGRLLLDLGEPTAALDRITLVAERHGVLGSEIDYLEGRARLEAREPEPQRARAVISRAVWRLVRLGAPRELGLCYVAMAHVEAATSASHAAPAGWLARAHPLIKRAGSPQDRVALRTSFRAFGRRAVDRLVDADMETRIEGVRQSRERLRDVVGMWRDAERARATSESSLDVGELDEALLATAAAEEDLVAAVELLLVERERIGQLVAVTRKLVGLERLDDVFEVVPRFALELLPAEGAEVIERGADGALRVVSATGEPLKRERARLERVVHQVLDADTPRLFARTRNAGRAPRRGEESVVGRMAAAPIRTEHRELALVVARVSPGVIQEDDLERMTLFASLAAASIERARQAGALQVAAARDAATIEAIRDGVVTLGPDGVVRALNRNAGRVLRVDRAQLTGRTIGSIPELASLAVALQPGTPLEDEIVGLAHGDALVRSRPFEGGTVVTLQELTTAQRRAHRLVGGSARFTFGDLVGEAPAFVEALEVARRAARSDVPVLITGESGTGKEMVAQALHNASVRVASPFVGVNVAAIPRELLESELFGYERGAFTGARAGGHPGKFELAEDGTLLLDEIGDMAHETQAKLLRVLQERTLQRLGGTRDIPIRARLVATTHRDLEKAVEDGSFRLDLFYRLRVVHLRLPPLRERRGDVPLLVRHYLHQYCARAGRSAIDVSPAVMADLERYHWPGNVRELANTLEGVASLLQPDQVVLDRTPAPIRRALASDAVGVDVTSVATQTADPVVPLSEVERRVFQHALAAHDGNVAAAARALGVARGTFYAKIRRYRLDGR